MYCNRVISVLIFLANNVAFPNWQTYIFFQYILKMINLNSKIKEFNYQDLEKTLTRGPHAIMVTWQRIKDSTLTSCQKCLYLHLNRPIIELIKNQAITEEIWIISPYYNSNRCTVFKVAHNFDLLPAPFPTLFLKVIVVYKKHLYHILQCIYIYIYIQFYIKLI